MLLLPTNFGTFFPVNVKSETLKNVDEVIDLSMQIAEDTIEVKDLDIDKALKTIKKDTIGVQGARIEGKYSDYINLMLQKHLSNNKLVKGEVIVLDSYDGAEHYTSNAIKASITSYNSQIFAKSMQDDENQTTTAESFNILTWQQILADEKLENIIPVVESIYEEKSQLMERTNSIVNECNFNFYDMHDAKMLYLITQHSSWSRKNHPFLLCKCQRGEGVADESHECITIKDDEQLQLYDCSTRRWERKTSKDETYTTKDHADWVDEKNFGVSHFGLSPLHFKRENIRFDVFHLCVAITKRLMTYTRDFVQMLSCDFQIKFYNVLSSFWDEFQLLVWKCNKDFSIFKGAQIKKFVTSCPKVAKLMRDNLVMTEDIEFLCKGLELWCDIESFLKVSTVKDKESYPSLIDKFKKELIEFYECGKHTFLTKRNTGDDETFYFHCLRFYIPNIVDDTWESLNLVLEYSQCKAMREETKSPRIL